MDQAKPVGEGIRLSREAYNGLLEAERRLHDLLPEFDKAESCGIECQYMRDATATYLDNIAKMKQNFAPR